MTPVEERIDHEEAKRIAKRFVANASLRLEIPFFPDPEDTADLARAYLDLLTEHSARDAVLEAALRINAIQEAEEPVGHEFARRAYVDLAAACVEYEPFGSALLATEPAQPEEDKPPEGYIAPEGDERCSFTMDACTCMKRKGHDGLHACVHGGWRG